LPNKLNKFRDLLTATGRGFLGRASIVLSGAVLGQGLAFLMLPLITRVYSPESIGRASTTLAIFSMLMIVICLQYDQAVVVASRDQLPYLLMLGCLIALGEVVLLALCLFILRITSPTLSHTLNAFGFNAYLLFLLLTYAPFLLLTQLHLRQNSLSRVSSGRFIYYGLGSILQVIN
jgi:O-antigen/teichoic acid export membrane protein